MRVVDGRAEWVQIRPGRVVGDRLTIEGALQAGDEVAVAGQTPQGISGSQCLEIGAIERGAPRRVRNIPESPLPALPLYTFGGTL